MVNTLYDPPLTTEDRRSHREDGAEAPHRRLNDSFFNKFRWPAFIYGWFALGAILLAYWLYWLTAD